MRTAVYSDIKEAIYAGYRPHYASAHTARGGIKIIEAVGERLRTPR
jgi:hypothetical protein